MSVNLKTEWKTEAQKVTRDCTDHVDDVCVKPIYDQNKWNIYFDHINKIQRFPKKVGGSAHLFNPTPSP